MAAKPPKGTSSGPAHPVRRPGKTASGKDAAKARSKAGPKRRTQGPVPLAKTLPQITKRVLGNRGFAEGGLVNDWTAIVGEEIARRSLPKKLTFPRGRERQDGTLILRVESGFATELQYLEGPLLERINAFFGYRAVARLRLQQGPVAQRKKSRRPPAPALSKAEEKALSAKISVIEDEELRAALMEPGRAVHRLDKS